ncbi:MAG: hypothetical protein HZB65_04600 [Candidatus Aenigmarchaeota archaeon]|nr:hypothetical protein [Candidatus Aenigmarchaeota archaeon]
MKDDVNEYTVIKEFLFPKYFKDHLDGKMTLGLFQISKDNKIKWLCWDFDAKNESEESLKTVFEDAKKLYNYLKNDNHYPLLEFSGRRGYHVWLFFNEIDAEQGKLFAEQIAKEAGVSPHEIFPKQAKLGGKGFGSMVKLPLGIHKVSNKRSFLFDDDFHQLDMSGNLDSLKNISFNRISKV